MASLSLLKERLVLAGHLSVADIRIRYLRAVLGPWWITLNTIAVVGGVGFMWSKIFGVDIREYLPFFAVSIILWNYFVTSVNEATVSLVGGGGYIKDRGVAPDVFVMQTVLRNLLLLAHTVPVGILALLIFRIGSPLTALMAVPGLVLFVLATVFTCFILAPLCARYRDLIRIVESGSFLLFVLSPVLWDARTLKEPGLILWNPMLHLLEAWRTPLLTGQMDWPSLGIASGTTAVLGVAALIARRSFKNVAYWV